MNRRLLWVDDEIEFLRSHIRFLETRGYVVVAARGADEAIRLIETDTEGFDVVLLDKQMPVKSGLAALGEIKELRPGLPVIMITGHQHKGDAELMKGTIDGYLTKPVDPNLILAECKRIIDSKRQVSSCRAADRYLRAFTENQARLNEHLGIAGLMDLHCALAAWDIELDESSGEGARQMHAGIKSDCGVRFSDHVAENYSGWIKGQPGRPLMPVDITEKFIAPELREGRSVLMIVLSGMRLDQFISIEPELKRNFSVSSSQFLSLLPTAPEYCLTALLSGRYPDALHLLEPDHLKPGTDHYSSGVIKRLMELGLDGAGIENAETAVLCGGDISMAEIGSFLDTMRKSPAYGAVLLDIMEMFTRGDPSETARQNDALLRERIRSWFVSSYVFKMMKEACDRSRTVVFTSDHGHVFCGRPAEVYGARRSGGNERYMFSPEGEGDERTVFIAEDVSHLRLPGGSRRMKCLVARDDHCFAAARGNARGAYRCGGVSPQEMIMPLYVCRPQKTVSEDIND